MSCFSCCEEDDMHKAADNGNPYMAKNSAGTGGNREGLLLAILLPLQFDWCNLSLISIQYTGTDGGYPASEAAPRGAQTVKVQPIEVPAISVEELKEVTENFETNALIGEGSYGRVYYGVLKSGQAAAIKKLDASKQPDEEFLAQVSMVSRLKHENFVQLLGYCVDGNSRVLAYEFASNGSLHDILHGMCDDASVVQVERISDI
ncbi:hypothetical protein Patl1_00797 [Pistacia atlantica]|uniref:Uncharacterized protein n=1 Tax=Pistacia atlantica TaxID=434234 RepID=A0ACC1CBZ4_9ROSI|nr:hypothetical protein Patl1_00797 [Pistacia atlantica]